MSTNQSRKVIVLAVDRLNPSQIGAYGNTCHNTDAMNRLAGRSILFDQAVSTIANLESSYRQLFNTVSINTASAQAPKETWLAAVNRAGVESTFICDRDWLAESQTLAGFDSVNRLSVKPLDRLASRVSQTGLARFFAQVIDHLEAVPSQSLAWIDCSGLVGQWDAPYELRQNLADPDDPEPPKFYEPANFVFDTKDGDPDALLGVQQAMDAQVQMLDDFIGVLLDVLDQPEFSTTLFCLTSLRGYPLGQHGLVGAVDAQFAQSLPLKYGYNESVHAPLMVCLPKCFSSRQTACAQSVRSGRLVTPTVVMSLIESFLRRADDQVESWIEDNSALPDRDRTLVVFQNEPEIVLLTHAWKFMLNSQTGDCELYAKPDDLWEVNDVSQRCPNEMNLFRALAEQIATDSALASRKEFRLPAELVNRHG